MDDDSIVRRIPPAARVLSEMREEELSAIRILARTLGWSFARARRAVESGDAWALIGKLISVREGVV